MKKLKRPTYGNKFLVGINFVVILSRWKDNMQSYLTNDSIELRLNDTVQLKPSENELLIPKAFPMAIDSTTHIRGTMTKPEPMSCKSEFTHTYNKVY